MSKVWKIAAIALFIGVLLLILGQHAIIRKIRAERDRYKTNTECLLSDVEQYKVRDSLNAARVESLELTLKEFERFRAEDAALIKELKARNRDLQSVNKSQSQTIIELRAAGRDTLIIRDSVPISAIAFHCGDVWYDFNGLLNGRELTGTLENRDSLIIAESVRYKRFLGFLWKTKQVKDRRVDVVSKNPHTEIKNVEYIVINP